MSLFAIADLHLSLSSDKPMDVFYGWDNYIERLESGWRAAVKNGDTVVIPGDISWAMSLEGALPDFQFIHSLPGKKIILKGNHDFWWNTRTKLEAFFETNGFSDISIIYNSAEVYGEYALCGSRGWLYNAESGNDKKIIAREAGRLETSLKATLETEKTPIVFLHYPPVYDGAVCREIIDVLKKYSVSECYFGHLHGIAHKKAVQGVFEGINLHLVSSDYLSFAPLKVL